MGPFDGLQIYQALSGVPAAITNTDAHQRTETQGPPSQKLRHGDGPEVERLGAFRLHDLRHNFLSWDISRGLPLEIADGVRLLLGMRNGSDGPGLLRNVEERESRDSHDDCDEQNSAHRASSSLHVFLLFFFVIDDCA